MLPCCSDDSSRVNTYVYSLTHTPRIIGDVRCGRCADPLPASGHSYHHHATGKFHCAACAALDSDTIAAKLRIDDKARHTPSDSVMIDWIRGMVLQVTGLESQLGTPTEYAAIRRVADNAETLLAWAERRRL